MKVTDLMIGDWVQNQGGSIKGKIVNIDAYQNRVEFGAHTIDADFVYPIPLTPEILEKNGYTCKRSLDKEIRSYNWTSPDRRVTLNDQNGSPWFCIVYSNGMMEEVMIGITYLHELQHALKLCKIEKEIVL